VNSYVLSPIADLNILRQVSFNIPPIKLPPSYVCFECPSISAKKAEKSRKPHLRLRRKRRTYSPRWLEERRETLTAKLKCAAEARIISTSCDYVLQRCLSSSVGWLLVRETASASGSLHDLGARLLVEFASDKADRCTPAFAISWSIAM
jgi:hypothetical protein